MWTVLTATLDKEIQNVVEEILDGEDNRLIHVSDLVTFFDVIEHEPVDLIIYDHHLPCLKALEAFSLIKMLYPNVPALLMYNEEKFDVLSSILEKGFVYRTSKPLDKEYLKKIFDSVCKGDNGSGNAEVVR